MPKGHKGFVRVHGEFAGQNALGEQNVHCSLSYQSWAGSIQRCCNPRNPKYPNYGGRGITICSRWRSSYADFLADMGPRPSRLYSLDRINNDGGYEPGNCRWATNKEQAANRRTKRIEDFSTTVLRAELHRRGVKW